MRPNNETKRTSNYLRAAKIRICEMMVEDGYSDQQIQEISGACTSAVVRWKRQYRVEKQGITPHNQKAITPEQKRIQDLEKQLARAKRDIDILKKASVDSSEESNSCTNILICMRARDEAIETNIYTG